MKLAMPKKDVLCSACSGLCCRYFAFEIAKPRTRRDFEDIRWYLLHEDSAVFVEDGEWYLQINRKCRALLPDNRCAIYETRPPICRAYKAKDCDWHAAEYDYDHLFCEPEQIMAYGREYLAKQKKRQAAAKARDKAKSGRKQGKAKSAGKASKSKVARGESHARGPIPLPGKKPA
jgi:uncharacterized protein